MARRRNLSPNRTLRKWGENLVVLHKLAFVVGGHQNHGGKKWEKRRRHYPWPIMVKSAKLRNSIKWGGTGQEQYIITKVPYAKYHQYGTPNMIARLVLEISQRDIDRLKKLLKDDLERQANGV